MTKPEGAAQLDAYLARLRRELRGLSPAEADETVRELRSHVLDRTGGDLAAEPVGAALAALGDPKGLARLNAAARMAARGEHRASPWGLVGVIAQVARVSLGGLWALLVSLVGYAFALCWLVTAAAKPFAPHYVGLWRVPDAKDDYSFSLGVNSAPHGVELLGWWIIPLGLLLGVLFAVFTYRFSRWSLRRLARPRLAAQPDA